MDGEQTADGQGRRASGAPSQAAPDRDELPAHPIPSPGQKSQGGSRQLFRDVTALLPRLQCPSWSRPTAPGTHNPIFNPCIAWRSPSGALEPWSPSSLGFYHLGSLLRSHPSIHPACLPSRPAGPARPASSLPDGLGRAKQGVTGHGGLDLVQCRITHR